MSNVTDEDRDLRSSIFAKMREALDAPFPFNSADHIQAEIEALISDYRQAARERALDEAAEVAEGLREQKYDDCELHAHAIASQIRKLKEA